MRPVDSKFKKTLTYGTKTRLGIGGFHKGDDFGCPAGTPVVAMVAGTVTGQSWGPAFGVHVVIDNDRFRDGSAGLWAGYAHLSKVKVKPGQRVKKGQIVGWSGASGHVTGPHLHVEIQKLLQWNAYRSVNPKKWEEA